MVDGLTVRGYEVQLETGPDARKALRRSLQSTRSALRVVCVSEALHPDTATKVLRSLDPAGRGDLLIVPLRTPRQVIERVERAFGQGQRKPLRRTTRAFLAHPTLVESTLDRRRMSTYGVAAVASTALFVGGLHLALALDDAGRTPTMATETVAPLETPVEPSRLVDEVVLSNAATVLELEHEDVPVRRRTLGPRSAVQASTPAPEEPHIGPSEEPDASEAFELLEPAPLEPVGVVDPAAAEPLEVGLPLGVVATSPLAPGQLASPAGLTTPQASADAQLFDPFASEQVTTPVANPSP